TSRAASPPGSAPDSQSAAANLRPAKAISSRRSAAAATRHEPLPHRAALLLGGKRPADGDQDRKVDDADRIGVEIAELLADLPIDLERRHRRPDEADLEERRLGSDVRPGGTGDRAVPRLAADENHVGAEHERRRAR